MLSEHDSSQPIYFGCRFKPFTPQGYMSGGAGYVLSREALERFVNKGLPSPHLCKASDHGAEDAEMGECICMEHIGVKAMDSRDALHRGRFFPFMYVLDYLIYHLRPYGVRYGAARDEHNRSHTPY
ncbi:unnamed protein product [Leptidea sinapis]|uniref:Hexosyltransferase n=1 Tax=Leptidea sinapis TaxID=189913 RepID=A0A5E4QY47_9NEOP|nr:unnamed protein product [Leptidea sinapis]